MHVPVDPSSPEPLYEQVRSGLADLILSGALPGGTALPSIRALARDLRVSVITITRAYSELVAEDLAVSRQGRGVFVRTQDPGARRAVAEQRVQSLFADAARDAVRADIPTEDLRSLLDTALDDARADARSAAGSDSDADADARSASSAEEDPR